MHVTDGFTVSYETFPGVPAPPTFYHGPCASLPIAGVPAINGLASTSHGVTFGPVSSWSPPATATIASVGQSIAGVGPVFTITVTTP